MQMEMKVDAFPAALDDADNAGDELFAGHDIKNGVR
jgi:hypothetical protein